MAAPPSTTTSTSDLPSSDGPVLSVITKRLRALRKKLNRILQMEESLSQGKSLNKEQQEVLRSKPSVLVLIDELEKLRSPLSSALHEELSLLSSKTTPPSHPPPDAVEEDEEKQPSSQPSSSSAVADVAVAEDLVKLMYLGSLFDVKQQSEFASLMFTRIHERGCCLTYDTVTDDNTDLLSERDLDLISALQGLMVSRPVNSTLSHRNALEKCVEHAKLWLQHSDQPIHENADVTCN